MNGKAMRIRENQLITDVRMAAKGDKIRVIIFEVCVRNNNGHRREVKVHSDITHACSIRFFLN
jgi:hypothetical protein